jgi:hypothetical protein
MTARYPIRKACGKSMKLVWRERPGALLLRKLRRPLARPGGPQVGGQPAETAGEVIRTSERCAGIGLVFQGPPPAVSARRLARIAKGSRPLFKPYARADGQRRWPVLRGEGNHLKKPAKTREELESAIRTEWKTSASCPQTFRKS